MKILPHILAAVALILSSCIEISSTVIISKDGAATIEETVLLGSMLTAMLQSGDVRGDQFKTLVLDKAQAEERARKFGAGVTVISHEEINTPDGKSGFKVVFAVSDLAKLKYVPFAPAQMVQPMPTAQPMTFALSGSSLTINNADADTKKGGNAAKPMRTPEEMALMKSQMAMMKPVLASMHVTVEVKAAGGIASSDATHFSNGTISYFDIQPDEFMDDTDLFFSVLESSNTGMSAADAAAKFSKVDGFKIEGKKVVKAELK